MSAVYNPEADTMAAIERLEREARDMRRRLEWANNDEDRRVVTKQLTEIESDITRLQAQLP
jgi:hypothetical protein